MTRTKQPKMGVCHPTLPAYAHSLCRRCYDSKRWSGSLPTSVSGEARAMAEQVAGQVPRADRKRFEESGYVRTSDPKVADFVAGAIVKHAMSVEGAVREIKPELNSYEVAETAAKLQRDPNVQAAVQTELKKRGLDEESKQRYIERLWSYFESEKPENEKRQLQAMRILGKAFIAEQVLIDEPETLPLRNLDEGLKRMGLVPANAGDDNESVSFDS